MDFLGWRRVVAKRVVVVLSPTNNPKNDTKRNDIVIIRVTRLRSGIKTEQFEVAVDDAA